MKIKNDFITNSSSVAFVVASAERIKKKDLPFRFIQYEYFRCFNDIDNLITYTQNKQCDWINRATQRPARYRMMNQREYEELRDIINGGGWAGYAYIERNNWDRVEQFKKMIHDLPFFTKITMTESY